MNQPHLLQQEKASYSKISAPCSVFGECGGCALQDLSYEDQLHLKRQRLGRAFEALGEVPPFELIGLEEPWRYRNKAELTFAGEPNCLTLGFHAAGSFLKIVDLNDCLLLPEFAISLLQDVRLATSQTGLSAYHPRTHQGFFRYLIVRISQATGKALLCLITAPGSETLVRELASQWCQRHPNLISCYWGVTCKVADSAAPETLILLEGQPYLEERLGPFRLKLHPLSFLSILPHAADLRN
ncbi:MAG: hypothetical protein HYU33_04005 [Candidatus Omnitrophica bacterium]|nr:hypothetical protein [Candidatus Omnitrophota bacterium]